MAWGSSRAAVWTDADTALWHTCRILDACATDSLEPVATVFPLAPGELAIVDGVFRADEYTAVGDGTYYRSGTFAFGRPSLVAGVLLANAASNAAARRRAQADAQVRWRPAFDGNLTVTTHGFVLHTTGGVHRWAWESVDFMQLEDRSQLILQGRSEQGPIAWRFHTWWAELLLYLWGAVRHPGHPQLAGGSWLPACPRQTVCHVRIWSHASATARAIRFAARLLGKQDRDHHRCGHGACGDHRRGVPVGQRPG